MVAVHNSVGFTVAIHRQSVWWYPSLVDRSFRPNMGDEMEPFSSSPIHHQLNSETVSTDSNILKIKSKERRTGGRFQESFRPALVSSGETVAQIHRQIWLAKAELDDVVMDGETGVGR